MAENIVITSTTSDGEQISDATFYIDTEISPDGRYVAFLTDGKSLVDGLPTGFFTSPGYWYIKDTVTGGIIRIPGEDFFSSPNFYTNIFEENYDVTLGNDYGIVTYDSFAARFDIATGEIEEIFTLPEDETSAFPPTAVTAGSTKYLFGWTRSINITEGEINERFFKVDMINTETGAASTASINLNLHEAKVDGQTTINFLENAWIKDCSTDGRYVFVEISLLATKSKPGSFIAGTAALDYGIYDTQTSSFTRITNFIADTIEDFDDSTPLMDGDDYRYTSYEISDDGKFAVISTSISNLIGNDTNGKNDVFLLDLTTHVTTRISTDNNGAQLTVDSAGGTISGDGRFIAYYSNNDLYVYDRETSERRQLNQPIDGTEGFISSRPIEMTPDGKYIVFSSIYNNYVENDTNTNREDVYRIANPFLASDDGSPTYLGLTNQRVAESLKVKGVVGQLFSDDPGDDDPELSFESNPGGLFKIQNGNLVLAKALDFEKASLHEVTIAAEDADGHSIVRSFDISVTDVVEDIKGNNKDNKLKGGIGADNIIGLDGNDTLTGAGAIDTLNGGKGKDKLDGGTQNDIMIGGVGRDTFIFKAGFGFDIVKDFNAKQDKLDLRDLDITVPVATFIENSAFVSGEAINIYTGGGVILLEGLDDVGVLSGKNVLI